MALPPLHGCTAPRAPRAGWPWRRAAGLNQGGSTPCGGALRDGTLQHPAPPPSPPPHPPLTPARPSSTGTAASSTRPSRSARPRSRTATSASCSPGRATNSAPRSARASPATRRATAPAHLPHPPPPIPTPPAPPRPPPAPTSRPLASSAPRPLATYLPTSYLLSNYRRAMRRRTNSSSSECSSSTPMVRPARRYVAVRVATNLVWPLDGQWLALDCAPLDLVLAWGCPRRPEFPTGALQFRCQVLDAAPGWGPSWWPWP